jgi:hypothetical protein
MYGKALSYAPTDSTLLLSRSLAHMMTTPPRLDLALADADAAIQYGPTNWQAWLQQGQIRLKMGDMDGAEGALVNAVGFAQGVDKLTAQRSLADLRSQRAMSPPVANRPASSVPSTSPATSPSLELPIRTPPAVSTPQAINTQPAPQASSTTSPATADSCPTSLPALTTQASSNLAPSPITTTSSSTVPAASNAQSAPAQSLSQGSWAWPSSKLTSSVSQTLFCPRLN